MYLLLFPVMTVSVGKENGSTASRAVEKNLVYGVGHALFLLCVVFYFVTSVVFFYKVALLGLLATLMLEVYSTCMAASSIADALFSSESTPYFYLSLLLYILPASSIPLLPLGLQSLLHLNAFARAKLASMPWWSQVASYSTQLLALRPLLLDVTAHLELVVLPMLLFSIFSSGLALPVVYGSFLRWQYFVSTRTRNSVRVWDETATKLVESPNCPRQVRKVYGNVQGMLKKWMKTQGVQMNRSASKAK
jgi:hypothetical protein